jgi:hypothetical protein
VRPGLADAGAEADKELVGSVSAGLRERRWRTGYQHQSHWQAQDEEPQSPQLAKTKSISHLFPSLAKHVRHVADARPLTTHLRV